VANRGAHASAAKGRANVASQDVQLTNQTGHFGAGLEARIVVRGGFDRLDLQPARSQLFIKRGAPAFRGGQLR
jgi:hypothetical protein